ncbi:MAG TPA: hypothetical protein VNU68_20245 [Verrucomicrobiae bacterium]|nr:hypothetical protein [Verrucomicrobiae bacterium]
MKTLNLRSGLLTMSSALLLAMGPARARADALDDWSSPAQSLPTQNLKSLSYGDGRFVAVGDRGTILASADGMEWSPMLSGVTDDLAGVAYGRQLFVAVGNAGLVLTSTNGSNWTKQATGTVESLVAVAFGGGMFVASSIFSFLTSTDGVHWLPRVAGGGPLLSIAYGNGSFFTVGGTCSWSGDCGLACCWDGQKLASSDGGTNWTVVGGGSEFGMPLWAVAFGNGRFVAGGYNPDYPGSLIVSWTNAPRWGIEWTQTERTGFRGVGFGANQFVAVGPGMILTSMNGRAWTSRAASGSAGLRAVAYGAWRFVAVGDAGSILFSGDTRPLLAGRTLPQGGFEVTVRAGPENRYRLQASDDLAATHWTDLLTFGKSPPSTNFVDRNATNFSRRFYRVVSP